MTTLQLSRDFERTSDVLRSRNKAAQDEDFNEVAQSSSTNTGVAVMRAAKTPIPLTTPRPT
ncbi:hypothetical protein ACVWWN_004023 [Mycobacterium sp. URHB0021]